MRIDGETFLASDVFNVKMELREEQRLEKIKTLVSFCGDLSTSKFQQKEHIGEPLFRFQGTVNELVQFFLMTLMLLSPKLKRNEMKSC